MRYAAPDTLQSEPCAGCHGRGFTAKGYGFDAEFKKCAKCDGSGRRYLNPIVDRTNFAKKGGLSYTPAPGDVAKAFFQSKGWSTLPAGQSTGRR